MTDPIPSRAATNLAPAPPWAILQRTLIAEIDAAAIAFADRYSRHDGTLYFRNEWPGMDGSDDPYEGFATFPLFYALGGSEAVYRRSRIIWEGITFQFTELGQISNEYDRGYDWMHHGESNLMLYFFGLADPGSLADPIRARRFAGLYTGQTLSIGNWDPEHRMIRAPITGSDGPLHHHTAEHWVTHREILDGYLPPFDDIPGVDPDGVTCPWSDDATYAAIIDRVNSRQARGDVPVNLLATSLATHAALYRPDPALITWVTDYATAWAERAVANNGILPDNIGLSGQVGEYNDGNWWGGYYGWRWPHGAMTLLESITVAAANVLLLTGDDSLLALPRSQLDLLWSLRRDGETVPLVPARHGRDGWMDYRPMHPMYGTYLWAMTFDEADAERAERGWDQTRFDKVDPAYNRSRETIGYHMGFNGNTAQWFAYMRGRNPDFPTDILLSNLSTVRAQIAAMATPERDPQLYDWTSEAMTIHRWQDWTPVLCEALCVLTTGGPMHAYHGGLQFSALRHFDGLLRRPGLPADVAALVDSQGRDWVRITLCNTGPQPRQSILQAGMFGEHRFASVAEGAGAAEMLATAARWIAVALPPQSTITLLLGLQRFCAMPSYATPWLDEAAMARNHIVGRKI